MYTSCQLQYYYIILELKGVYITLDIQTYAGIV